MRPPVHRRHCCNGKQDTQPAGIKVQHGTNNNNNNDTNVILQICTFLLYPSTHTCWQGHRTIYFFYFFQGRAKQKQVATQLDLVSLTLNSKLILLTPLSSLSVSSRSLTVTQPSSSPISQSIVNCLDFLSLNLYSLPHFLITTYFVLRNTPIKNFEVVTLTPSIAPTGSHSPRLSLKHWG
jgi:hypothetical protein